MEKKSFLSAAINNNHFKREKMKLTDGHKEIEKNKNIINTFLHIYTTLLIAVGL